MFKKVTFLNIISELFNFFDRVQYKFGLEFKIPDQKNWEPLTFQQKRKVWNLVLNSQCNEALAQINIIEHFARDIQELQQINPQVSSQEVRSLTTFKLVRSLLQARLQEYELGTTPIQFKIVANRLQDKLDVYISDWLQQEK